MIHDIFDKGIFISFTLTKTDTQFPYTQEALLNAHYFE